MCNLDMKFLMSIYIWANEISSLKKGTSDVSEVYVWDTKIRPTVVPIDPWIYWSSTLWLISVSSDWENWITIRDKNEWATEVWNYNESMTDAKAWYHFQWWNNYGFPHSWNVTMNYSYLTNASSYWPTNYYNSSTWKAISPSYMNPTNFNMWWDTTDTLEARRWPCPQGYHIAKKSERETLRKIVSTNGTQFHLYLKLPRAWYRYSSWWFVTWNWDTWWYHTSDLNDSSYSNYIQFWTSWNVRIDRNDLSNWYSIRAFKNEPVIPDDTWTKIR